MNSVQLGCPTHGSSSLLYSENWLNGTDTLPNTSTTASRHGMEGRVGVEAVRLLWGGGGQVAGCGWQGRGLWLAAPAPAAGTRRAHSQDVAAALLSNAAPPESVNSVMLPPLAPQSKVA